MMNPLCVLFDLDGTLLNTLDDLTTSVNATLSHLHCPTRDKDDVRRFLGNGYRYLLSNALPANVPESTLNEALQFFGAFYAAHCLDQTRPYDGMAELLERLKKESILVAIVSNKGQQAASEVCERFFPDTLVIGETSKTPRKPSPAMLLEAVRLLGADKERTVFVGDSEVDIQTAEHAAIPCISCTWGFRNKEELLSSGATTLVETVAQLGEAIDSLTLRAAE